MLPATWQHALSVAVLGLACHFSWQASSQPSCRRHKLATLASHLSCFSLEVAQGQTESQWTQYNRNGRRYYLFSTIVLWALLDCNIQPQFLIHKSSSVFELQSGEMFVEWEKGEKRKVTNENIWTHTSLNCPSPSVSIVCALCTLWREKCSCVHSNVDWEWNYCRGAGLPHYDLSVSYAYLLSL